MVPLDGHSMIARLTKMLTKARNHPLLRLLSLAMCHPLSQEDLQRSGNLPN